MLIEDTDESVRAATIKSIAVNTVYIYDSDKYAQVISANFLLLICVTIPMCSAFIIIIVSKTVLVNYVF